MPQTNEPDGEPPPPPAPPAPPACPEPDDEHAATKSKPMAPHVAARPSRPLICMTQDLRPYYERGNVKATRAT